MQNMYFQALQMGCCNGEDIFNGQYPSKIYDHLDTKGNLPVWMDYMVRKGYPNAYIDFMLLVHDVDLAYVTERTVFNGIYNIDF